MRLTANRIAGIMRQNGYKLTPQRHAVLKVLAASEGHLIPDKIYQKARRDNPAIGRATIYRTLEILSKLKLVCRLHSGGCCSYMMRRPVDHHHHLICSGCGRVVDFSDCGLEELEKRLARESKFDISGHMLEFYGLCCDCQGADSA